MCVEKNDSSRVLEKLIRLCDDLAWGRPADENALFELTKKEHPPRIWNVWPKLSA